MKTNDATALTTMAEEDAGSPFEAFVGTIVWNYLALEAHFKNMPAGHMAILAAIMGAVFSVCFVAFDMPAEIKKGKLWFIILNLILNVLAIRLFAYLGGLLHPEEIILPLACVPPLGLFIWSRAFAR